jgi:adenylate cyclase
VDLANTQNAMVLVGEALNTTASAFNNQINTRNNALTQAGKLVSGDFAFKTAYASMREQTIRSALDNHRQRVGADLMLLLSLDGKTIAGSGQTAGSFIDEQNMFPFPDFIGKVMEAGEASGMVAQDNAIYSIIAVPLLTPVPSAWIILGFQVDDALIRQLQQDSHADVSIVTRSTAADWKVGQTTLKTDATEALINALQQSQPDLGKTVDMPIGSSSWFTFISPLPHWGDTAIYAVLQRSSDDALAPYYRLRQLLLALLVAALIISVIAGGAIASSVTRPVQALVSFAGQIQRGDYQQEVAVGQRDELGQLAQAFNDMSKGLRERDKVRNLLGKVISPEIAEELINKDVKLGGEEREMTILFTDLRNFTGLSEKRAPAEVLTLLNEYLTLMTAVIDKHGGVVDKYIGDAIMALFGAPLELPDHANRAVHCAIEMTQTLASMNRDFRARGLPELGMGIGVNTGNVVVGNMGSKDRLNYTVIGDNVNLASRLESVTKEYGVPIIVSEATRILTVDIEYRMLDRITVKGKQEAVTIYTPVISLE